MSPVDKPFSWDSVKPTSTIYDGSIVAKRTAPDYYVVSRNVEDWGAQPISPLAALEIQANSFRDAEASNNFEIVERGMNDGLIEIEMRPIGGRVDFTTIWGVDPAQGFSTRYARTTDSAGRTRSEIQVLRNVEVSPGVWAPVEATLDVSMGPNDAGSRSHLLVVNATYNDPNMDPEIFRIDIPPDARVYDADLNLTIQNPPPPDRPRERPAPETFEQVVYRETEKRMEASEARRRESGGVQVALAETEPSSAFSFFSFGRVLFLIALAIAGAALIRWSYVVGKRIDEAEIA
jgi:hypothetical protein